jgi:PAS domain S-box-containing protein
MNRSGIGANESVAHRSSRALPLNYLQRYGLAVVSIGVALGASLLLQHFGFRVPSALLLLFAVAISSWYGGPGPAVLTVILSAIGFYWYFVEPFRTIYIDRSDIPLFIVFTVFAALLSWFGTVRRRVEADLHERADLLNLTHDTVFVMDMEGVIKYWNRAAEERYGWTADQAVGKVVHDLLKTVFPAPLDEIKAEVTRAGRWEGELLHTRKDGSHLVAASRWSLERGKRGEPVAILETNNDITERTRAEDVLRRLNRELRAISNCNQVLLRATDEQSLLDEVCRIVCEEAGYRMAWVGYAEHDEAKSVRPVAWTGAEEGYLASAGITWADTERGRGLAGTTIRSGKGCCIQDFATDLRLAPWREDLWQRGFRSGIALPLKDEHANTFGILSIYSAQPNAFTPEEVRLLEELAGDLAFGIVTLRSRAARKQAEQALRQSEAYLAEAQKLSHAGSWALDAASREYIYWSDEMFRIFGVDPQGGIPIREAMARRIHPEDIGKATAGFEKSLRENVDTSDEYRFVLPDGTLKHIQSIRHPVLNEAGNVIQLVGTFVDITERKRSDEALRRSEAYLAEAQRLSHTGSFAFDVASNKYFYISEECRRIFELDSQQSLPRGAVSRFIDSEDWVRVQGDFEKLLRDKVDMPSEFRIVLPSGAVKHIQVIRHPVLNEAGEVATIVGTAMDITERKLADEALRRSEAYLADAQRLTHTGSWAHDGRTREPLYWSEEVYRILGVDPQNGLPTRDQAWERIHPEDRTKFKEASDKTFREKVDYDIEYRIVPPNGAIKHVHAIGHPVLNGNGDVVEVVGTIVDITERKCAEEALRESEMRFRTFVDHAADAFCIFDEQHKIIDVNREACQSSGYTREELIGMVPQDFDPDVDTSMLQRIDDQIAAGEICTFETRNRRKDGTVFPVEVRVRLFQHGGHRLHLAVARDISERKRAEKEREKLRQLETELAHINRVSVMGELTASIAHEVNQPLSGVVSNGSACLRWLAAEIPNLEEAREATRRIVRDGKRAAEVISRIRAMTKKAAENRERLDLNETIGEVLALVGDEAKKNRVVIRTEFADDVFPVVGDRVQLQQVVLNLAMNAIEAMSKVGDRARELVISTRNIDPDQVQVTVEDSGTGIDPQMTDKIFDSFYTTKAGGMGMGLSISRSILQAHGGRLWATAKDGTGTILYFTLPKYHEEESNA